MQTLMNPLAHDPQMLTEFRHRVERRDWTAARRLGLVLQLHRIDPQRIFERDDVYLRRLARRYAATARRNRSASTARRRPPAS